MLGLRWVSLLAPVVLAAALVPQPPQQAEPAMPDEVVLADFTARVDAYVALHRRLEGTVPTLHVSRDPAEVRAAVTALGRRIRLARSGARQGDMFAPPIASFFRQSIRSCLAGQSIRALLDRLESERYEDEDPGDHPAPLPEPRVNRTYPVSVGFPMMPPSLLCALPALPDELQYRLVGRDLILWDHHADLVVDVLPKALPPPET